MTWNWVVSPNLETKWGTQRKRCGQMTTKRNQGNKQRQELDICKKTEKSRRWKKHTLAKRETERQKQEGKDNLREETTRGTTDMGMRAMRGSESQSGEANIRAGKWLCKTGILRWIGGWFQLVS